MEKTFYDYELNGKKLIFHKDSTILVQLGKGKSSYRTRYSFKASEFSKAVFYFNCLNVGKGYKKRLIVPSFNKPLLARVLT